MGFFILFIYLIFYLIMPHAWGVNDYNKTLPLTVLTLLIGFLFFLFNREPKVLSHQLLFLFLLCPTILLSALTNQWFGGGLISVQQYLLVAILPFILLTNFIKSNEQQKTIMWLCIFSAVIMISNGVSQINSEDGFGWAGSSLSEGTRITYIGVLNDPNDLGSFFVLVLPFTFFFSKYGKNIFSRLSSKVSSLLILYGIFLTNSRGALLATITMFGMYFYLRYGKLKSFFLGLIFSPIVFLIMSNFRKIDTNEESASGRVDAWYEGIEMFKENPFLGVGMGGFTEHHHLTAHNSFILVIAELGSIGYGLWFCFYTLSFYMLYSAFSYYNDLLREGKFSALDNEELSASLLINNTLFYSFIGYSTSIFFLSRSYNFFTYFICALTLSSYLRIVLIEKKIEIKNITNLSYKLFSLSLLTIFIMYFLVKILI